MKKFAKLVAVLTALLLGMACFTACSNDDGEEGRSVVAKYQEVDNNPYVYTFYSDGTYEYKESQQLTEKGIYYCEDNPTKRDPVTMQRQYFFDVNAGKLIPDSKKYEITIYKEGDDLCFDDDCGNSYFLNN